MPHAQNEDYYYLTPVGWHHGTSPAVASTRFEAWVQLRTRRIPWSRPRVRWECLWADVSTPRECRDDLRARHPFPKVHAPATYGQPK